jgi:hypothetical protein
MWDDIEDHLATGDLYRARAHLESALGYYQASNILGFSEHDHRRLETTLANVEQRIAEHERSVENQGASPP